MLPRTYQQITVISMDSNIIAMDRQVQKHKLSAFFKDLRNIKATAEQTVWTISYGAEVMIMRRVY